VCPYVLQSYQLSVVNLYRTVPVQYCTVQYRRHSVGTASLPLPDAPNVDSPLVRMSPSSATFSDALMGECDRLCMRAWLGYCALFLRMLVYLIYMAVVTEARRLMAIDVSRPRDVVVLEFLRMADIW